MTPRSLVGMTMGARRRAARAQYMYGAYILRDCRRYVLRLFSETKDGVSSEYKRAWRMYRIGQRLRPCPGCAKCDPCMIGYGSFCGGDPRLFTPDETRSTEQERERHRKHCEEWSSGKRLTATDSDKLVEQAPYGLGVSRWTNNSAGTFCDGSGVIPAKARKVRR